MLNRVTNLTTSAAAQRTLQAQQSKLAQLQEKATTLDKISRPSDDPAATAQALDTRARLAATAQYGRNIDDGNMANGGGFRPRAGHQRDAEDQGPHSAGRQWLAAAIR